MVFILSVPSFFVDFDIFSWWKEKDFIYLQS